MKNTFKKVMGALMVAVLMMGVLAVPTQKAQAASKNYMKGLKLNWDLKKNKKMKVKSAIVVLKKVNTGIKITNYKLGNAKKEGYKKLTFSVTFKNIYKRPSDSQIHKMVAAPKQGGGFWWSVADFNTGLSLEEKNDFDVRVKSSDKKIKKKKYTEYADDHHTCCLELYTIRYNVSITYPENYDGLCIGVGGNNQINQSSADKKYWVGKVKFGKTTYYKKGKKNSHWMRIRASKKQSETSPETSTETSPETSTETTTEDSMTTVDSNVN